MPSELRTPTTHTRDDDMVARNGDSSASRIFKLRISKLVTDSTYQRPLEPGNVASKVARFDWDYLGHPCISARGDAYYIIDGQHRIAALRELGHGDACIDCEVFAGLTQADEARMFYHRNDMRKPTALAMFRARVASGESQALAINDICNRNGYYVQTGAGPSLISCVAKLDTIYEGARVKPAGAYPESLDVTLRTLRRAWPDDDKASHAVPVETLGLMHLRYGNVVDWLRVATILAESGSASIFIGKVATEQSQYGGNRGRAGVRVLTTLYNKRRSTGRLDEW